MTEYEVLERVERMRACLDGLSSGDAFGECYFGEPERVSQRIAARTLREPAWRWTDDTAMALSIVDVLRQKGVIDQQLLASLFAKRYLQDPRRGYGGTAHDILSQIARGMPWRRASYTAFNGMGSMGNGGAMRAAPVGAYFYDDYKTAAEQARLSAEVTHAHLEGQAGAAAVALAAACAARGIQNAGEFFETILRFMAKSETRSGIEKAASLPFESEIRHAVSVLGNGSQIISQDTVPFALWCAAAHLEDYEEALWRTVSGLGDRDTTCAIVGGILAANPAVQVPAAWLAAREALDGMR